MNAPRIRGRVGELIVDNKPSGKYCFEISIWDFEGKNQVGERLGPYGNFATQKEAMDALKNACKMCCEEAERQAGCAPSGKFMDMKAGGVMRRWEEN